MQNLDPISSPDSYNTSSPKKKEAEIDPKDKNLKEIALKSLKKSAKSAQSHKGKSKKAVEIGKSGFSSEKVSAEVEKVKTAESMILKPKVKHADIQRAKIEMDFKTMGRRLKGGLEDDETYQIQTLDASLNPVAHLKDEIMIPRTSVPESSTVMKSRKSVKSAVWNAMRRVYQEKDSDKKLIENSMGYIFKKDPVGGRRSGRDPTPIEYLNQMREKIQALEDVKTEEISPTAQKLLDAIADLEKGLNFEGVSNYYRRDAVVANLRLKIKLADDELVIKDLLKQVERLQSIPDLYISSDQLEGILSEEDQMKVATRNLIPYVSSFDVMRENVDNQEAAAKTLLDIVSDQEVSSLSGASRPTFYDRSGYAFKLGIEVHREVLAGKMADLIGANEFLLPKAMVPLEKAIMGKEVSPEGLASRWLSEGKSLDIKNYFAYTRLRNKISQQKRKGEEVSETDQKKLAELQALLEPKNNPGSPDRKSVNYQAWLDLVTCSYDSHAKQYIIVDGGAQCIDFARFCPPAEAYKNEELLMVALKSTFIDHPFSEEAMPEELVTMIQDLDTKQLKEELGARGLIGSKEFFDERRNEMLNGYQRNTEINESIRNIERQLHRIDNYEMSDDEIKKIFTKYGLPDPEPLEDEEELEWDVAAVNHLMDPLEAKKRQLIHEQSELKTRLTELREECFSKIHPQALEGMVRRIEAAQKYIDDCEAKDIAPTIRGAFHMMMPAHATLNELYEKYVGANPGLKLATDTKDGAIIPLDIRGWLRSNLEKMTKEDQNLAKEAVESLDEMACDALDMVTTMDL